MGTQFPSVQPGDIWQLGSHRLLCGDCTDAASVAHLMRGEAADLLFTDPPYGVRYGGNRTKRTPMVGDDLLPEELQRLLVRAFLVAPLRAGGVFYICSASGPAETTFRTALAEAGLPLRQALVWAKHHFVLSHQDYHNKHETILYGWKPGAGHYFVADRRQHTIWEYRKPHRSRLHPTMKPVELVARAILNSTRPFEIVYDGFGGSGTTLIAAEQTARAGRIVEINPGYCSETISRWVQETGQTAVLASAARGKKSATT